jgi:hypothetical protein
MVPAFETEKQELEIREYEDDYKHEKETKGCCSHERFSSEFWMEFKDTFKIAWGLVGSSTDMHYCINILRSLLNRPS